MHTVQTPMARINVHVRRDTMELDILNFLKAFLPKIELVILPGQSYHIIPYFISFVFVASSALWRMSTCSLFTVYVMQERKVVIP